MYKVLVVTSLFTLMMLIATKAFQAAEHSCIANVVAALGFSSKSRGHRKKYMLRNINQSNSTCRNAIGFNFPGHSKSYGERLKPSMNKALKRGRKIRHLIKVKAFNT
jgi:hypothetical protein